MSNQIVITSGAKVRELNDVIIGTSGVLSSLAFNVANGVPKLDSNAKILVSQLPNSVMEYQGTWNAATNTPTLTNGGAFNQGDVYLCNVAGTTNFGAGPISFIVGDSAIYSGSIWQRSGGATGSVTSVGLSTDGNAITIGSSPITTSGTITANFAGTSGQYINGAGNLTTFPTLLSSVGLSMPSAFSVSNSPLTANGTIAVTGAGYPSQYIRGDGTLADFPTSGGGGSSVSYYLNGGTSQGTIGGVTYYEMSKTADTGTGVDFPKTGDGLIVSFLTDANDPAQLNIPAGNWNYEIYASMSANGGTPEMYAELYKYDGTTFTLISTSSNEILYDGTNLNLYTFAMTVPSTTLAITDRLAIKLYATNSGGKITTVHTQDSHLCQIITTFSTGITALNGLTAQVQYFGTGTSGTDFNISSVTATHTFNLPTASATNRGALSSADWTTFNSKVGGSGSDGRVAFWNGASTLSSNANLYWDNSTSRLGINTNTPNASLGILNASSTGIQLRTSDSANQYQANIYWDASYGMVYGYNRLGSGTASNLSFYNSLGGFISVPESSNNNIGFNTINPQGLAGATVYDFTSLNTNVELRLHNSSTGYTSSDGSYIRVTSSALVIANAETSKSILINNGGNGVVTIDGTNKVAIGDIGVIPMTQQLTVVGSIEAYGGSIYQTVTSSMLKANASGQIIAAVGGTDYEYPLTFSSPLVRTTNTISMPAASTSVSGYLTSTDWNTFNNKGSGTVTSVSGTAPVVSSGGATPNISMAAATTSVSGYLTSTDWTTFNNKFTLPSLTQGSILFSDGSTIAQNNNRLYWNNSTMRLGVGSQPVAQYVMYVKANVGENANAWLGIDNDNATGSTALRLILNGGTTSGFQYVQSTNLTQIYSTGGDIQLINGSSLGLTIANTTGAATFSSSITATTATFTSNDNNFAFNVQLRNTNTGTQALTGFGLSDSSNTRKGQVLWIPSNYVTTSLQNSFLVSSVTNVPLVLCADATGAATPDIKFQSGASNKMILFGSTGNISISSSPTDAGYKLDVTGTGRFSSSVTASSLIKSGGTSSQFLKADGSVDSTTYGTFTLPSLTSGSVLFSNGSTIAQDNANFYWDDTNNRLGIGTSAPASILHILGASATLIIDGNSSGTQTNAFLRLRTGGFNVGNFAYNLATDNIQISNVSGGSGGGVQIFGTGGSTTGLTIAAAGAATFSSKLAVNSPAGSYANGITVGGTGTGLMVYASDTGNKSSITFINASNYNYGVIGVVSGTGAIGGDVFGLGYISTPNTTYTSVLNWTSGGNVGIGNDATNPANTLYISNTTNTYPRVNRGSTSYEAGWKYSTGAADSWYTGLRSADGVNSFHFFSYGTSTSVAQITNTGNVLIGTTTDYGYRLALNSTNALYITGGSTASHSTIIAQDASGNNLFVVRGNGKTELSTFVYNNTVASPRTLFIASNGELGGQISIRASKTNIQQFDSSWLMKLNPVSFNYRKKDEDGKYTNEHYNELFYGLIAEETELVNKEICTYNDDKLIGIEYSKLVPVLLKAIQEQQTMITSLQEQINELKNK